MRNPPKLIKRLTIAAIALSVAPGLANASIFGSLGNFDAVNSTGSTAHGFEIDLEGLHSSDITDTFGGAGRGFPTTVERYGAPTITEYNNGSTFGVKIVYAAKYAAGAWSVGTPSGTYSTPGESCWTGGGIGYGSATPCDHFGVGMRANPTKTTYSWLLESGTPGVLTNSTVNIPAPVWTVTPAPPPAPGIPPPPPIVQAQIQAPPPENNIEFGTPIWTKVFTTEVSQQVPLEGLMGENALVKQAKPEVEWQLLQSDLNNPNAGILDNGGANPVGNNAEAVIRRYEFYKYTGAFDQQTNEALFIKAVINGISYSDSNPYPTDVGSFIGAQNAALNFNGVAPVPEPESYAMMLTGIGLLGFMIRRKMNA